MASQSYYTSIISLETTLLNCYYLHIPDTERIVQEYKINFRETWLYEEYKYYVPLLDKSLVLWEKCILFVIFVSQNYVWYMNVFIDLEHNLLFKVSKSNHNKTFYCFGSLLIDTSTFLN